MADLTAKFKLVDEMSDRLGSIAESGQQMIDQWEQAGEAANAAFEGIAGGVATATSSVDGVATSIDTLQGAADNAASSADTLAETMNGYGNAAGEAAQQTDYWTDAVGNYDKSALEAVYTTEELVDMGLKSAAALEEQERMFELCDQSASSLSKSIEATSGITSELSSAMDEAASMAEELSKSDEVSAETKAELAKASVDAAEALQQLTAAQEEANAAMENYDAVMASGTTDLGELEAAAERAGHAAENLAEANGKASDATEELAKATEKASEEAENGEKSGIGAVEGIASALAAAGITATVKEIAESVYELVDAFSEAESTVVKATGASGEALDGLTNSMMNAYAASKSGSLEDTAGAIGEINTRMALTGDELTDVTGKFLDYANITGTNVVSSVQNVTKIMNKWGVEGSEVESVLDKLAYAGQISGISVDNLSSTLITGAASFQEMGLSLDNAISMLAQFELYGMSGTTAITAMRTAVKNFSDDGLNAETALQSVINEIANMESAADATALAVETFGSRAGVDMANAIRSGAVTVDSLTGSLEAADGTLAKTATTAQTLDQKWTQASNNISSAFTKAVEPTISKISSGFADLVNGVGKFLNEHPAVTKAITAIGVGLGVVVAGIAGVTFVTTVAIPAITAFGTALNVALGPIGWVALAIAGVVAAGTALVAMMSDAEDETAGMTASTREQYYELKDLNEKYDEACAKYGETSEEASRLKYEMDDLQAAFEANRQTVEEFTAEVDALCESVNELSQSYNKGMGEAKSYELGTLALIQKYEDLATQAELTGAQQEELEAITKKLSETFPDLASQIDTAKISTEDYVAAMQRACEQQAEQQRQQQAQETYVEALQKQAELEDEIAKAEANLNAEREAHGMYFDEYMQQWQNGSYTEDSLWASWTTDLDEYNDAMDELLAAQAENNALIAEIEQNWAEAAKAAQEAEEQAMSYEEAAATAYENVKTKIEELCAAYDEAYEAALTSFEGQFGLFDEASTSSEEYMNATVENAQAALDSQLSYWDSYLANIETLKATSAEDLGVTQENYEALMQFVQDGSAEATGLANSMVEAINSGNTEAVTQLATTAGEVATKREEIAAATADWATNFTEQMDAIEKEMQSTVEGMNLDTEAAASATATINGYVEAIKAGKSGAVAAAQEVANAVTAALASANTTVNVRVNSSSGVAGHANGTTDAESVFVAGEEGPELIVSKAAAYANGTTNSDDYYIAGENGPELIVGQQGSTVFPTEETDRLINALTERQPLKVLSEGLTSSGRDKATEQVKRILLEIAGSGSIEVGGTSGGTDKETILEVLYEHLKPVLMSIIQSEIYEEGELTYEF